MNPRFLRSLVALSLGVGAALAAQADSTLSTASSAGSTSVGSVSNSVQVSSNSSSGDKKVADGNYRVHQVAELEGRPGMLRVHLTHAMPQGAAPVALTLDLPREALGARGLAMGDVVNVRNRAYGLAFARPTATAPEVFFLALEDAWRNDLNPRAVSL